MQVRQCGRIFVGGGELEVGDTREGEVGVADRGAREDQRVHRGNQEVQRLSSLDSPSPSYPALIPLNTLVSAARTAKKTVVSASDLKGVAPSKLTIVNMNSVSSLDLQEADLWWIRDVHFENLDETVTVQHVHPRV